MCFPGLTLKFVTVFWRVREDTNQSRTLTGFTQLQEPQFSAEPATVWRSGGAWPQSAKLLAAPCGTECEREVSTQSLVLGHIGTLGHSGARVMSHYRRTKRNKQTQSWKNNSNYITWAGFTNTFLFTGVWNKLTRTWELNTSRSKRGTAGLLFTSENEVEKIKSRIFEETYTTMGSIL